MKHIRVILYIYIYIFIFLFVLILSGGSGVEYTAPKTTIHRIECNRHVVHTNSCLKNYRLRKKGSSKVVSLYMAGWLAVWQGGWLAAGWLAFQAFSSFMEFVNAF